MRRHRFSDEPLTKESGVILKHPTSRDRQIFELLDPVYGFKYLTTEWLHFFLGGNLNYLQHRLAMMQETQNKWLNRPEQQWQTFNAMYKSCVYERTSYAETLLGILHARAFHRSSSFEHEMLTDLGFYAPLRFAVAHDPSVRLIGAKELSTHEHVPEATRKADDPYALSISGDRVRLDGSPFILVKAGSTVCVPGLQVDRGTEGVVVTDKNRSALGKHILHLKEFFDSRMYRSHFGFENSMVPIITKSEGRMKSAMAFTKQHIGDCKYLVFKTLPDIATLPHYPKPSGEFFTTPWKRAGHPDFTFL